MATSLASLRQEVMQQTKELRQRILLTEGEGKAYYEESEAEKLRNKTAIARLRVENRALRARIHEAEQGEERAVERVLQQERRRHSSAGGRPSPVVPPPGTKVTSAAHTLEQTQYRLHDLAKKLNGLKHIKANWEERLATLQAKLLPSGRNRLHDEQATIRSLKEEHVALENELERTEVQVAEARAVLRRYSGMAAALRGEAALHTTSLHGLHQRLQQERHALKKLRESRQGAERTRDLLKSRLHAEELSAYEARRERERKIAEYRQRAEERRVSQIAAGTGGGAERRLSLLRSPQRRDSADGGDGDQLGRQQDIDDELEKYMTVFTKMKVILGVPSVGAVLVRVSGQTATHEQLQQLRGAALAELRAAEEEREDLQQALSRLKYAATEDASRTRAEEDAARVALAAVERRLTAAMARRDGVLKHLAGGAAALMHVAEKLEGVMGQKVTRNTAPVLQTLALLEFCRAGVPALLDRLPKEEEDQPQRATPGEEEREILCVPVENVRVEVPHAPSSGHQQAQQQVEEDSGDDEAVARRLIKRSSHAVVEAKSRKRNRPVTTSYKT